MFPSTAWRHPCRSDCIDVGSTLTVIRDEERARNSKQSILYYLSHKPQRSTFEMNYWWILYSYWVQQRWMHAYSIRCFPFPHHIRTCHIQHTIIFWDLFFFRVRFTFVCSWHFCTSITVFDAIGASNDYNQIETKCNRKKKQQQQQNASVLMWYIYQWYRSVICGHSISEACMVCVCVWTVTQTETG